MEVHREVFQDGYWVVPGMRVIVGVTWLFRRLRTSPTPRVDSSMGRSLTDSTRNLVSLNYNSDTGFHGPYPDPHTPRRQGQDDPGPGG